MPKCNGCGFQAKPDEFDPCMSAYHDFKCPKCGTSNVDSSDINTAWREDGRDYGYGDDNFLKAAKSAV